MKKLVSCFIMSMLPFLVFAEAEITDQDILTILKAIGCMILFLLIPGIIIGLICAGIRTLRGFFDI